MNLETVVTVSISLEPFKILNPTFDSSNGNHPSGLVINEWMPFNENEEEDEFGEYNDWIELFNNSNQSINLEGYFISNKIMFSLILKFL